MRGLASGRGGFAYRVRPSKNGLGSPGGKALRLAPEGALDPVGDFRFKSPTNWLQCRPDAGRVAGVAAV